MSSDKEAFDCGPQGGIFNFYCELPAHLKRDEIGLALLEIDSNIRGIQEPPVASLFSDMPEPEHVALEDYRRFYIEFHENATQADIVSALDIVTGAIRRLRQ